MQSEGLDFFIFIGCPMLPSNRLTWDSIFFYSYYPIKNRLSLNLDAGSVTLDTIKVFKKNILPVWAIKLSLFPSNLH